MLMVQTHIFHLRPELSNSSSMEGCREPTPLAERQGPQPMTHPRSCHSGHSSPEPLAGHNSLLEAASNECRCRQCSAPLIPFSRELIYSWYRYLSCFQHHYQVRAFPVLSSSTEQSPMGPASTSYLQAPKTTLRSISSWQKNPIWKSPHWHQTWKWPQNEPQQLSGSSSEDRPRALQVGFQAQSCWGTEFKGSEQFHLWSSPFKIFLIFSPLSF